MNKNKIPLGKCCLSYTLFFSDSILGNSTIFQCDFERKKEKQINKTNKHQRSGKKQSKSGEIKQQQNTKILNRAASQALLPIIGRNLIIKILDKHNIQNYND